MLENNTMMHNANIAVITFTFIAIACLI